MLHVLIIAFELNLVIVQLVRHQVQPTARLLQHYEHGHLRAEVRQEMEEGHYNQRVIEKLVG